MCRRSSIERICYGCSGEEVSRTVDHASLVKGIHDGLNPDLGADGLVLKSKGSIEMVKGAGL